MRLLTSLHFPSATEYEDLTTLCASHWKSPLLSRYLFVQLKRLVKIWFLRYFVNQSGGAEIRPVYKASFRVHRGNGIGLFFRGLFRFVKPQLYSMTAARRDLKMGSNITNIVNMEPEGAVGDIFNSTTKPHTLSSDGHRRAHAAESDHNQEEGRA